MSECELFGKPCLQLGNRDADLLHGVAVADGHGMVRRGRLVAHGLEVDGDAVRRADLVLAAITLADGTGIVEIDHEFLLQVMVDFLGSRGELLRQRQDGRLVRRKGRVQMQDGADVVVALLVLPDDLFVVGIGQEGRGTAR